MTSAIQDIVYDFYTTGLSVKDVNNAILMWQASLGYISTSITQNWMAIAQDNGIKYLGDIDMQNGVATGLYTVV